MEHVCPENVGNTGRLQQAGEWFRKTSNETPISYRYSATQPETSRDRPASRRSGSTLCYGVQRACASERYRTLWCQSVLGILICRSSGRGVGHRIGKLRPSKRSSWQQDLWKRGCQRVGAVVDLAVILHSAGCRVSVARRSQTLGQTWRTLDFVVRHAVGVFTNWPFTFRSYMC